MASTRRPRHTYAVRIVWPSRPGRLAAIVLDTGPATPTTWGDSRVWQGSFALPSIPSRM